LASAPTSNPTDGPPVDRAVALDLVVHGAGTVAHAEHERAAGFLPRNVGGGLALVAQDVLEDSAQAFRAAAEQALGGGEHILPRHRRIRGRRRGRHWHVGGRSVGCRSGLAIAFHRRRFGRLRIDRRPFRARPAILRCIFGIRLRRGFGCGFVAVDLVRIDRLDLCERGAGRKQGDCRDDIHQRFQHGNSPHAPTANLARALLSVQ
jgi:hypothetical protein